MFAVESPAILFYARLSGQPRRSNRKGDRSMNPKAEAASPQTLIVAALVEMVPSTVEEIAEATGLDSVTALACLNQMSARCKVMFNPLTKRFSLPKTLPLNGRAA